MIWLVTGGVLIALYGVYRFFRWACKPDISHAQWQRQQEEMVGNDEARFSEEYPPPGYPKRPRD